MLYNPQLYYWVCCHKYRSHFATHNKGSVYKTIVGNVPKYYITGLDSKTLKMLIFFKTPEKIYVWK